MGSALELSNNKQRFKKECGGATNLRVSLSVLKRGAAEDECAAGCYVVKSCFCQK